MGRKGERHGKTQGGKIAHKWNKKRRMQTPNDKWIALHVHRKQRKAFLFEIFVSYYPI